MALVVMPVRFPEWLEPMAATLTQERFTGPEWIFERKFDGIRLLAFKQGADVRLFSRNRLPQTISRRSRRRLRELPVRRRDPRWRGHAGAAGAAAITSSTSCGSTAATSRRSRSTSGARCSHTLPLSRRSQRVAALDDAEPWERACREGWEGVIAKRRDSPYEHAARRTG